MNTDNIIQFPEQKDRSATIVNTPFRNIRKALMAMVTKAPPQNCININTDNIVQFPEQLLGTATIKIKMFRTFSNISAASEASEMRPGLFRARVKWALEQAVDEISLESGENGEKNDD